MDRKLAAILVADIVGYSAKMENDEGETFAQLAERRKTVFEPEVARHGGRIFKFTGDGFLAEFSSAVHAVECAVSLQDALGKRNADLTGDQAMIARIGINLGEVIVEGDDLFGDGVNLAARIEPMAEPGGICVSEKVAREVERKLAFSFESMGERRVKNITEPVHVYRVRPAADGGRRIYRSRPVARRKLMLALAAVPVIVGAIAVAMMFWHGDRPRAGPPTLAVLPFSTLGGDPAQANIGAAVADDIITMLSTSPLLRVMSRSSSFSVPPDTEARKVAQLLQTDFVLDGSIQQRGENYSIAAELVDGGDGTNVWADRFVAEGADVPALQEKVASKVYATIAGTRGEVADKEIEAAWGKTASSMEEYEYHLRGAAELLKWTDDGKYKAWQIWTEGLDRFPDSALLKLELAALRYNRASEGPSADPWADIQAAMRLIGEASSKPDRSRMEEWLLHYVRALVAVPATGDFAGSVADALAAHALVPFDPMSNVDLSRVLANGGETKRAVEWAEYAVANEAVVPDWYRDNLAWAYLMAGRADEAVAIYETLQYYCIPCKAVALVRVGRQAEAKQEIDRHRARFPAWSLEDERQFPGGHFPFMVPDQLDPYLADLRAAGLN